MPMSRAVRLCPALVIVRPDFAKYRAVSEQVFAIFRSATPLVEPMSLDEAYLDVTENVWGEPLGMTVARRIKQTIREIASGWQKPDGLTVIAPERVESFLQTLPVDALWGVGPRTAERLRAHGIRRLIDVRAQSLDQLRALVGSSAQWLLDLSYGRDERAVEPNHERKSCGSECTYETDLTDMVRIRAEIDQMARDVAAWLVRHGRFGRTVVIKVRYDDFTTITRSQSEAQPTQQAERIAARAVSLLDKTDAGRRPVRLLGVSVQNLDASNAPKARGKRAADDSRLPLDLT
jgi:DNA polymerase-4